MTGSGKTGLSRVRGLDWKRNALLAIDRDVELETIATRRVIRPEPDRVRSPHCALGST
jgi:hypothetical protein